MKEKPILFSGTMVRAILEGRKTMTRRVVKPQPDPQVTGCYHAEIPSMDHNDWKWYSEPLPAVRHMWGNWFKCPYQIGQTLWVRETFSIFREDATDKCMYRADTPEITSEDLQDIGASNWKPSIFMPRWASRINLEVTNIRVERLQEINEEDAKREGVEVFESHTIEGNEFVRYRDHKSKCHYPLNCYCKDAKGSFISLWNSINGKKYPWSSNPWVFVISFKKLDKV
jgi:hypothetical protein